MAIATVLIIALAVALAIILLHELTRYVLTFVFDLSNRLPASVSKSRVWIRSNSLRGRFAERYPSLTEFIRSRVDVRQPTGLPLSLMVIAAFYLAALFSGLTEDILEAQGTTHIDNFVNAALGSWRVEPLISASLWITALGSSPSAVAAVVIATGFLWSQRRLSTIFSLWITCLGAIASTSAGKFLIGRDRPTSELDITVMTSSFPSGHATTAMAVYGFIGYAIARNLPRIRDRFEIAYWTSILILFIGFSRIFLGVHYLTDVIGGFLVGGFWLLVGFAIAEWNGRNQIASTGGSLKMPGKTHTTE